MKLLYLVCAVSALLSAAPTRAKDMMQDAEVEQSTESPIADMALIDSKDDMMMDANNMDDKDKKPAEAQPHTIADFIIHPLIALKARQPTEEPNAEGKQAAASSTTPSPWQLFGFNTGQGLGSSVSSLAGSVTGWLGNRIQLPGLVDTPVRESTSTSTTTTTTLRPDVVVRVQQRQSTRKPLISINNENRPFKNRRKNSNRNNNNLDNSDEFSSEYDDDDDEDDDDDDDYVGNNKNKRKHKDDDEDFSNEDDDEEDDEEEEEEDEPVKQQQNNNNNRRRNRPMNNNYNNNNNGNRQQNNQRRRVNNNKNNNNQNNNNQRKRNQNRRQPQQSNDDDNDDEYDDDDDDSDNQEFYYNQKRSQNQQNFIQRGQQSIINQIRQLTRGQSPAEIGNAMRKPQKASSNNNNKKRRQQATLLINRNGQTVYVAPELLQAADSSNNKPATQQYQYYQPAAAVSNEKKRVVYGYPQPPLTTPSKRKGKPTQYITIPWSQLGIAPPNQVLALTEGLQAQPLILNIPQSAIQAMQSSRPPKRKQVISAEAVPLLAEASLMDIFKPPRIPPARTPTNVKPTKKTVSPVVIASKTKPGRQRVRPGTIVEKAPADVGGMDEQQAASDNSEASQYIIVGDDGEAGLSRSAYPKYNRYLDYLQNDQQFAYRDGRQLLNTQQQSEQLIPVQIVTDQETFVDDKIENEAEDEVTEEEAKVVESTVESAMSDAKQETPSEVKEQTVEIIKPDDEPAMSSHSE